jgi:hypothetical protein
MGTAVAFSFGPRVETKKEKENATAVPIHD